MLAPSAHLTSASEASEAPVNLLIDGFLITPAAMMSCLDMGYSAWRAKLTSRDNSRPSAMVAILGEMIDENTRSGMAQTMVAWAVPSLQNQEDLTPFLQILDNDSRDVRDSSA